MKQPELELLEPAVPATGIYPADPHLPVARTVHPYAKQALEQSNGGGQPHDTTLTRGGPCNLCDALLKKLSH